MAQEQLVETPQVTPSAVTDEVVELVDAIGAIAEEVKEAKKIVAQYDKLRKQLVSLASENIPAENGVTVIGTDYSAQITEQIKQNDVINKAAIYEAVGNDTFVEMAKFSITDLRKYLTPHQLEKAVAEANIGPRRLTLVKHDS